ncbi:MAG: glycerate-2-kinase family protein, partial [Deltaproteobacteria bacterium]|nr:glycerate-2-kinase family protein [Deltaproteobacteria bacterium]
MMHSSSERRQNAIDIFQSGLQAVAPGAAILRFCQLNGDIFSVDGTDYDLRRFENIVVLGAGKAAAAMARAVEDLLGGRISAGVITVKYGHLEELKIIKIQEAGHPVPDQNGFIG